MSISENTLLISDRLLLQLWKVDDDKELFAYASNPNVGPHAGWKPHESVEESRKIIEEIFLTNIVFKIVLKDNNKTIGSIGLEPDKRREGVLSKELGYSLDENYWNQGIMTEASKLVIDYGFKELGLEVIAIQTGPENIRSQKVIQKLGFQYEGTERRGYRIYDGSLRDVLVYSMLKEEWNG